MYAGTELYDPVPAGAGDQLGGQQYPSADPSSVTFPTSSHTIAPTPDLLAGMLRSTSLPPEPDDST